MAKGGIGGSSQKVLLTGIDLVRGAVTNSNGLPLNLLDVSPFQMIPLEDKDEGWIRWNADFHESIGYQHVKRYGRKKIKNRWLAAGILDRNDYLLSPDYNNFADLVGIITPEGDHHHSPLEQFYPIIPNIVEVLKGEFLKRDTKVIIKAVDEFSQSEALQSKEDQLHQILMSNAIQQKQMALAKMGILPDSQDPKVQQQYQSEMQQAQQIAQVQEKFKSYRSVAENFAQHVLNVDREAHNMDERETRMFVESLINSEEHWHIRLLEDRFKLEELDSAYCFSHLSPTLHYDSDGDYFGWFRWMTVGDVINTLGDDLNAAQLEGLKTILSTNTGAMVVPDMWKSFPSMYYDTTKAYPKGRTDPALNDAILERNLRETYATNTTNEAPSAVELLSKHTDIFGQPHMFRVMELYWRSQRMIGFLTKIDETGQIVYADWVDENFKVTEQPKYDNSLVKGKTKYNLVFGEHVDWTYGNEWRHLIKINSNMSHTFWQTNNLGFNPIYIDGKPVKFQFRGDDNPYECKPPIEGRVFKYWGVRPVSLVDRTKPWQIIYNICNNKVPRIISLDPGIQLAINKGMIPRNYSGSKAVDPKSEFMDDMRENKIIEYEITREQLELPNQAAVPQRVDLSMIADARGYFDLGVAVKQEALQAVGITMQRLGETKASETLGGNQTAINFSETQTEPYFNQHINELMPRVIARMVEAAQFYCATKESARVYYMNDQEENVWLEIEGTSNLPRHYHIYPTAKPRTKQMMQELKQLLMEDNTMGATFLEKAQGILADSIPEYLRLLKENEQRREQAEQDKQQGDMQQQQADRDAAMALLKEKQSFDADQNDKNRQKDITVAEMRAGGGMQTDVNQNGVPDSQDDREAIMQKQSQADNVHEIEQRRLDQDKNQFGQNMNLEREKLKSKEKISDNQLAAAKANKASRPKAKK